MIRGMRLYKRFKGGKFLAYYVEMPNGKRRSLKTKDKAQAKRSYRVIENEMLKGRIAKFTGDCVITLGQYYDEFVKWASVTQKRSTFRANRLALDKLIKHAGRTIKLNCVSQRHIDMMVVHELKHGKKIGAINNYIRHAKSGLKKAVEWEYVQESPLKKTKQIAHQKEPPKFIPKKEIHRFINSIKNDDIRFLVAAYFVTGRRRSELVNLRWEHVNFKKKRYTIVKSKPGLIKSYHLNAMFESVLLTIGVKEDGRIFKFKHPDTVSHYVKKELVRAGYTDLSLHSIRHSYATVKAEDGMSLREIQGLLGHKDIKATEIYAHLTDDHLSSISEINIGPINLSRSDK